MPAILRQGYDGICQIKTATVSTIHNCVAHGCTPSWPHRLRLIPSSRCINGRYGA